MAVNKIVINGDTKIDLSSDTVEASDVLSGKTFHDSQGVLRTGSYVDGNDAVTQTNTIDNADYRVLFSANANDTTETTTARKNTNLKFNPSTGNLQTTQINGVTVGSSPKFTDNNTWKANTSSSEGYVTSGSGQANKVWKTDSSGNPAWREDAGSSYEKASQSKVVGDTSATFTDAKITTSSKIRVWFENASETFSYYSTATTAGQCIVTFPALTENTTLKLEIL